MEGCIWKNSKLYSQANKMQKGAVQKVPK